jgi:Undecaprenyl-phosphate glucose phosphotransferase
MDLVEPVSGVIAGSVETPAPLRRPRKWPFSYRSVSVLAVTADVATVLLCGILSGIFYSFVALGTYGEVLDYVGSASVVAALFVSLMKARDLYNATELLSLKTQVLSAIAAWTSVFLFLSGAAFALKVGGHFSRGAIFFFFVSGLTILVLQRILYRDFLTRGLNGRKFSGRNAILITEDAAANGDILAHTLLRHGFQLDRQFALPVEQTDPARLQHFISDVVTYLRGSNIEEIIVGVDANRWGELNKLLSRLRILPLPVSLIPIGSASGILNRPTHVLGDSLCIELHRGPLDSFERTVKRSIDVVSAFVGLFALLPALIVVSVLIKLDSPGPILFRQRRRGFNGRPFDIFKFRTMSVMEDGPAVSQAVRADGRVTRIGRWLRRTSIDELPQLLNILNSSMSLVGPRPHAVAHDNHFDKMVSNYAFRQNVKPGLTGWAQVNGQRGPTPTVADIRRRVDLDLWYIDNWSLRLDSLIIMRTFLEITRGRNAY